jgi:methyl-accepting chemotaxis protein
VADCLGNRITQYFIDSPMINLLSPWNTKLTERINELELLLNNSSEDCSKSSHKVDALTRSMAVIEFDVEGNILAANENYLNAVGYELVEIIGKHDSIFVSPDYRRSLDYSNIWARLKNGESLTGDFLRLNKIGEEICLRATYNPVFDRDRRVTGVIKLALDITAEKRRINDLKAKDELVDRVFAVIQFTPDGTITNANKNFLTAMGYSLAEIVGKHHSIFVDPEYSQSVEYKEFWSNLRTGSLQAGEYRRVRRDGRDVFIQASYNPVFGLRGEVTSIVKFATDVTTSVEARKRTTLVAHSVASSVSQMTQTIHDISGNVSSTAELAQKAESLAGNAKAAIQQLNAQSQLIGKVVETIRELAEQTNLLALNATIESARAGESGRGFAVVASEVKELAKQTSVATQSIEQTVHAIQQSIKTVVSSADQISSSVASVNHNMSVISAAVEEQSVTYEMLGRHI